MICWFQSVLEDFYHRTKKKPFQTGWFIKAKELKVGQTLISGTSGSQFKLFQDDAEGFLFLG